MRVEEVRREISGEEEGRVDGSPLVTICVSAKCSNSVRRSYL